AGYAVGMSHLVCAAAPSATETPSAAANARIRFMVSPPGREWESTGRSMRLSDRAFVPYLTDDRRAAQSFSSSYGSRLDHVLDGERILLGNQRICSGGQRHCPDGREQLFPGRLISNSRKYLHAFV